MSSADIITALLTTLVTLMKFDPPLIEAILVKRYKRFLADVTMPDGSELTVHCPNTGSMKNCWEEGWKVYLQDSNNPKRKYRYTWVAAINNQGELIGVNTHFANKLIEDAVIRGTITELSGYSELKREIKYGNENSKIDLLAEIDGQPTYIEVKSVTLKEDDGIGYFPDSVSTRGQKHLRELIDIVESGQGRAVLCFCVQHSGISQVAAAQHIDAKYAELMKQAAAAEVEIIAYKATISRDEIVIDEKLSVII
ncbi:MAG: DNA/RNA nuclease SfsA [Kangiellaceae bacterium]|jgi:sugar fermentation stimulation protein A|nr:DNA/RNA nuclease SfsA [Kangiellaceae bacterium]